MISVAEGMSMAMARFVGRHFEGEKAIRQDIQLCC